MPCEVLALVVQLHKAGLIGISRAVVKLERLPIRNVLCRWSLARHNKFVTKMLDFKHFLALRSRKLCTKKPIIIEYQNAI